MASALPLWLVKVVPLLEKYAPPAGIPIDFLLGWIKTESGGHIGETTVYDERGYFQLMPSESKKLGFDHQGLSSDPDESVRAGVALAQSYASLVDKLPIGKDHPLYWPMVKFMHSIGPGAAPKFWADMVKNNAVPSDWNGVVDYAKANESRLFSELKHSPTKWTENVAKVLSAGRLLGAIAKVEDTVAAATKKLADPKVGLPVLAIAIAAGAGLWMLTRRS